MTGAQGQWGPRAALRLAAALSAAVLLAALAPGAAFANFGPHGGYTGDTDSCAGCHRAHTSFSEYTWVDDTIAQASHSALLISQATNITEFCFACHGDDAPGASTNVLLGVFDSGPAGAVDDLLGDTNTSDGVAVTVELLTNSSFDATLNGGGFLALPSGVPGAQTYAPASSAHDMDIGAATDPAWGMGSAAVGFGNLACTSCHDPHGSSNYRILRDNVNGHVVGGFIDDNNPTPFVTSAEEGYPLSGWRKHAAGAAQMALYRPNFTEPEYRNNGNANENISGWCAACHEAYVIRNDNAAGTDYDYGDAFLSGGFTLTDADSSGPNGQPTFHRHPVNTTLVAGDPAGYPLGTSWLRSAVTTDARVPVEMRPGGDAAAFRTGAWEYEDFLGCLTCHRAHGTSAVMTGWAEASLETTNGTDWYPVRLAQPAVSGVNPNFTSALLRTDNRGVCERCHNK